MSLKRIGFNPDLQMLALTEAALSSIPIKPAGEIMEIFVTHAHRSGWSGTKASWSLGSQP